MINGFVALQLENLRKGYSLALLGKHRISLTKLNPYFDGIIITSALTDLYKYINPSPARVAKTNKYIRQLL